MAVCYIMGFVLIASTSRCAGWNQEAHWPPEDTVSQAECCPGEEDDRTCRTRDGRQAGGAWSSPTGPLGRPATVPGLRDGVGDMVSSYQPDSEQGSQETIRIVASEESAWTPSPCWVLLVVT